MNANIDRGTLTQLANVEATSPVLSIYLRTDPRDPANGRATPAWRTELTTGLNEVGAQIERIGSRDHRLAFRELHKRMLSELPPAVAADPRRSRARFVALDGSLDQSYTFELPLRESLVRLDDRPYVSPLVDLVDRGAAVGVVLVGQDRVRVLECVQGRVDEAEDLELEIDRSDWRERGGSAGPARQRPTVSHESHRSARDQAQRDRFLTDAAAGVAARIEAAGWDRVVMVASDGLAPRFHLELPAPARDRVRLDLDLNLHGLPAPEIARRLEPHLEALYHDDALALADDLEAAGANAALGAPAVLAALAKHRVEALLVDPLHLPDTSALPAVAEDIVDGGDAEFAPERAVKAALASDADVTALSVAESTALAAADGMMASLRW